ncbi:hypothetical protein CYMTET_6214 [Cymbomonas tetramitiformis]|uniref:Uncharacterized protein n=1 Tax=Cymbomonas tetramitiformis TaxID=36881 RepID=A0AAE0GXV7_9CHLO|nr:hypothetical protein CYMTET_6214 [Cymbomonas tetramitiformis]
MFPHKVAFSEPDAECFENENFPEADFVEGESNDGEYTPEEWAAWDAGSYDSTFEDGGAQEEFIKHFDAYDDVEYHPDDCY